MSSQQATFGDVAADSGPAAAPEPVSFENKDSRRDDMAEEIEARIEAVAEDAAEARESDVFQEWAETQAKFHSYSLRNTLLIKSQMPDATRVAGFWDWQNKFDRAVQEGESAIWIWGPIITEKCPECGNAESYHEQGRVDCDHHEESDPEEWDEGVVGFKPLPVYDVSQTEGEPLPELPMETEGDGEDLLDALISAADSFGYDVELVEPASWTHGKARGVCHDSTDIEVMERDAAATAATLAHEIAHARHITEDMEAEERDKREIEAEATAYVVGEHFGLEMERSAFYLASWAGEETDQIKERMDRIARVAGDVIETVEAEIEE